MSALSLDVILGLDSDTVTEFNSLRNGIAVDLLILKGTFTSFSIKNK